MKPDLMHEGPERTPEYPQWLYYVIAVLVVLLVLGMVMAVNRATALHVGG